MADFPNLLQYPPAGTIDSFVSFGSLMADISYACRPSGAGGGVWPASNRALYIPFLTDSVVTAYQMAFEVTVQSGNCDVGIYDELGNRLVSKGSTAVGAAGIQTIDITDTVLTPGLYYMAMNVDNTTAAVVRYSTGAALHLQVSGMRQQAVGAVTLPDPATFANPASAYLPRLVVSTKSTI